MGLMWMWQLIINAAKRYPMMSEHQVVIVKEAQAIRNIEELSYYLQKPLISTILVVCHKHGTLWTVERS